MIGGKNDFQSIAQLLVFNGDIVALIVCQTELEKEREARKRASNA
jgi:hypothetical protein